MGNYSWLLKIINGDCTIIDWKSILPIINSIRDNNYFYIDEKECSEIVSITDLSNFLNDRKLFGYLTNSYIESLCKICLHTKFTNNNEDIKYPKMYFEEEGWDRIHFLEFHPKTEDILWGSYAFDFNYDELKESLVNEYKLIHGKNSISSFLFYEKHLKENIDDDYEIIIWDEINKRKKEYMLNLINDKFTNWNIRKLEYSNKINNNDNISLLTLITLFGIREEDYLKNPEETTKKLKEFFNK